MNLLYCILLFVPVYLVQADDLVSKVLKYDAKAFEGKLAKKPHFVMFYAPWCGHCKRVSPTWDELAEKFNVENEDEQEVVIAKVDCTVDTDVCSSQAISGYPTMKFYRPTSKDGSSYTGARTSEAMQRYIRDMLRLDDEDTDEEQDDEKPDEEKPEKGLWELTDRTFYTHIEKGLHFVKFFAPWCGHCQRLAPTWEQLAESYQADPSVSIAKVDCTAYRSICTEFEVKGYPTLLLLKDGKVFDKYQGGRSHEEFKRYLTEKQGLEEMAGQGDSERIPSKVGEVVTELTADNFDNAISSGVTFVKFYVPWCGHCKRLAPVWEVLSEKFLGNNNIKLAAIDCDVETNKPVCKENGVNGYPTLILFRNGFKLNEYSGSRTLEELYTFVMGKLNHDEL